jgi:hypothetical protein
MHSASDPRRCRPCRAPPLSHSSRLAPRTGSSACIAPWYWGVHPTNKSMYPYHIHWYFLMEHSTWLKHWYPAATHDYRSGALWVLPPVNVHGDCLLFGCCSPGETNQSPSANPVSASSASSSPAMVKPIRILQALLNFPCSWITHASDWCVRAHIDRWFRWWRGCSCWSWPCVLLSVNMDEYPAPTQAT